MSGHGTSWVRYGMIGFLGILAALAAKPVYLNFDEDFYGPDDIVG